MLYQVMYRLPGSEWREYGLPVNGLSVGAVRFQCERQYTTASVVVVEGNGPTALRDAVARQVTLALAPPDVDRLREQMEMGTPGDHDTYETYQPTDQDLLAWAQLLARVQRGELEP